MTTATTTTVTCNRPDVRSVEYRAERTEIGIDVFRRILDADGTVYADWLDIYAGTAEASFEMRSACERDENFRQAIAAMMYAVR
jgi:hypothetical protein